MLCFYSTSNRVASTRAAASDEAPRQSKTVGPQFYPLFLSIALGICLRCYLSIFPSLTLLRFSCFFVLSCHVLSCPVLCCAVLSCPILSCPVPSHPVASRPVLPRPVLFRPIPPRSIDSRPAPSNPVLSRPGRCDEAIIVCFPSLSRLTRSTTADP